MDLPSLIEPNSRAYLVNSLKKCHDTRVGVYYYVFNFGVLFIFVLIFGLLCTFVTQINQLIMKKNNKC